MKQVINSSKELYEFYKAWLDFAEGRVSHDEEVDYAKGGFLCGDWGLCGNCDDYATFVLDQDFDHESGDMPLTQEMKFQFDEAGLDIDYPFGSSAYYSYGETNTCHKDPNRLQWVRDRIADYKESRNGH